MAGGGQGLTICITAESLEISSVYCVCACKKFITFRFHRHWDDNFALDHHGYGVINEFLFG